MELIHVLLSIVFQPYTPARLSEKTKRLIEATGSTRTQFLHIPNFYQNFILGGILAECMLWNSLTSSVFIRQVEPTFLEPAVSDAVIISDASFIHLHLSEQSRTSLTLQEVDQLMCQTYQPQNFPNEITVQAVYVNVRTLDIRYQTYVQHNVQVETCNTTRVKNPMFRVTGYEVDNGEHLSQDIPDWKRRLLGNLNMVVRIFDSYMVEQGKEKQYTDVSGLVIGAIIMRFIETYQLDITVKVIDTSVLVIFKSLDDNIPCLMQMSNESFFFNPAVYLDVSSVLNEKFHKICFFTPHGLSPIVDRDVLILINKQSFLSHIISYLEAHHYEIGKIDNQVLTSMFDKFLTHPYKISANYAKQRLTGELLGIESVHKFSRTPKHPPNNTDKNWFSFAVRKQNHCFIFNFNDEKEINQKHEDVDSCGVSHVQKRYQCSYVINMQLNDTSRKIWVAIVNLHSYSMKNHWDQIDTIEPKSWLGISTHDDVKFNENSLTNLLENGLVNTDTDVKLLILLSGLLSDYTSNVSIVTNNALQADFEETGTTLVFRMFQLDEIENTEIGLINKFNFYADLSSTSKLENVHVIELCFDKIFDELLINVHRDLSTSNVHSVEGNTFVRYLGMFLEICPAQKLDSRKLTQIHQSICFLLEHNPPELPSYRHKFNVLFRNDETNRVYRQIYQQHSDYLTLTENLIGDFFGEKLAMKDQFLELVQRIFITPQSLQKPEIVRSKVNPLTANRTVKATCPFLHKHLLFDHICKLGIFDKVFDGQTETIRLTNALSMYCNVCWQTTNCGKCDVVTIFAQTAVEQIPIMASRMMPYFAQYIYNLKELRLDRVTEDVKVDGPNRFISIHGLTQESFKIEAIGDKNALYLRPDDSIQSNLYINPNHEPENSPVLHLKNIHHIQSRPIGETIINVHCDTKTVVCKKDDLSTDRIIINKNSSCNNSLNLFLDGNTHVISYTSTRPVRYVINTNFMITVDLYWSNSTSIFQIDTSLDKLRRFDKTTNGVTIRYSDEAGSLHLNTKFQNISLTMHLTNAMFITSIAKYPLALVIVNIPAIQVHDFYTKLKIKNFLYLDLFSRKTEELFSFRYNTLVNVQKSHSALESQTVSVTCNMYSLI